MNVGDEFGPYTIESVLGRGGMGTVFLARHARLDRRVALKVIAPELADDPDFRARFLRESQLAASLDHPHVIPIYDADEIDTVLYLAMRYVDGPSLQALIRESGPLSRGETLRIAGQIGGALDAAHAAALIHRDLKPANILLTEADRHAYLCDFGLAKRTSSRGVTHAGSFLGTVDYCSPEQIRGEPLDGRADVYSFGCVLYHCLSGEPPYARESEIAVLQAHLNDPPPSLAPDLDGLFARAMAKDRDERYPTAGALASDLRAAIAGGAAETVAVPAEPPTRVDATGALPQRKRRWRWAVAAIVLLAVAAAAAAIWATRDSSSGDNATDLRPFVDPHRTRAHPVGSGTPRDRRRDQRGPQLQDHERRRCPSDRKRQDQPPEHPPAARELLRPDPRDRPDGDAAATGPAELDRGRPSLRTLVQVEHPVPAARESELRPGTGLRHRAPRPRRCSSSDGSNRSRRTSTNESGPPGSSDPQTRRRL